MKERQRVKGEIDAMKKIMRAYLYLKDPYYRDALGHARALCLDAIDCLEMALGIDDDSQSILRIWDKRFKKPPNG